MKGRAYLVLMAPAIVSSIFLLSGCTAIGFGIGAIIDSNKSDYDTIPVWHAASIERGKDITIVKKSGEVVKGKYIGLDTVATSQYAQSYDEIREKYQKDIALPVVGDSISFSVLKPANEYRGEFLGFDYPYLWVRLTGIRGIVSQKIDMTNLGRITDKNGNLIETGKIKNLFSEWKLPTESRVTVKTDADITHIPTAMVARIEIPNAKDATLRGLVLGALCDVGFIFSLYVVIPNTWHIF
jgi:hypothetical protein